MAAGYFTSRPTSKGWIRSSTSFLQAARHLEVLASQGNDQHLCRHHFVSSFMLIHTTCLGHMKGSGDVSVLIKTHAQSAATHVVLALWLQLNHIMPSVGVGKALVSSRLLCIFWCYPCDQLHYLQVTQTQST